MHFRPHVLLALCLALPLSPACADDAACIDAAKASDAITLLGPLSARAEELVRLGISEGVSSQSVYLLTRQMMLVERIHRLLVDRDHCGSQADSLERDVAIVKRVFVAFTDGDAELQVEAMKSEQSQALLAEINTQVVALDTQL